MIIVVKIQAAASGLSQESLSCSFDWGFYIFLGALGSIFLS
jgi:hypothetical protein